MNTTFERKHKGSAGKDEWLTPPYITEQLGPFDLDPCSPIDRPWPTAKKHYTILDDGLNKTWGGLFGAILRMGRKLLNGSGNALIMVTPLR